MKFRTKNWLLNIKYIIRFRWHKGHFCEKWTYRAPLWGKIKIHWLQRIINRILLKFTHKKWQDCNGSFWRNFIYFSSHFHAKKNNWVHCLICTNRYVADSKSVIFVFAKSFFFTVLLFFFLSIFDKIMMDLGDYVYVLVLSFTGGWSF